MKMTPYSVYWNQNEHILTWPMVNDYLSALFESNPTSKTYINLTYSKVIKPNPLIMAWLKDKEATCKRKAHAVGQR